MEAGSSSPNMSSFLPHYDYFIFDCDGVVYKGANAVPGAVNTLKNLLKEGKKVFFLSNSSGKTREEMTAKMKKLGFDDVSDSICFGSAYLTGQYLQERHPSIKKVRVVGMDSIKKELSLLGITSLGAQQPEPFLKDKSIAIPELEEQLASYPLDEEVGAVVVGLDTQFNYTNAAIASMYLQRGAKFIATNTDNFDYLDGKILPGAGAMVQCIQTTLRDEEGNYGTILPEVVGKPNPFCVDFICKQNSIQDRKRVIMIGDRPDTDIALGNAAGIDSCLVLTGVTANREEAEEWAKKPNCKPTYVMDSIGLWD